MRTQKWIADPRLQNVMGRGPFLLFQVLVNHAYRNGRLFVDPLATVEELPFMSLKLRIAALKMFPRLARMGNKKLTGWTKSMISALECGGLSGGWVRFQRVNYEGNRHGALRYMIPIRLLKPSARPIYNNISSPSENYLTQGNYKTLEAPKWVGEAWKAAGSVREAFDTLVARGAPGRYARPV